MKSHLVHHDHRTGDEVPIMMRAAHARRAEAKAQNAKMLGKRITVCTLKRDSRVNLKGASPAKIRTYNHDWDDE